jgi:hypothetical protein
MTQKSRSKFQKHSGLLGAAAAAALIGCGAPVAEQLPSRSATRGAEVFPQYRAKDLNGRTVTAPADGESSHVLVLVAFKRHQQQLIDRWLEQVKPMLDQRTLDFLELPVIREMNPVSRWFIDRGMRGGIRDPHTRARVVTLFTDKNAFRRALSIPDEESIYVYLVRREDRAILWRTRGGVSDDHLTALSRKLGFERRARR